MCDEVATCRWSERIFGLFSSQSAFLETPRSRQGPNPRQADTRRAFTSDRPGIRAVSTKATPTKPFGKTPARVDWVAWMVPCSCKELPTHHLVSPWPPAPRPLTPLSGTPAHTRLLPRLDFSFARKLHAMTRRVVPSRSRHRLESRGPCTAEASGQALSAFPDARVRRLTCCFNATNQAGEGCSSSRPGLSCFSGSLKDG